MPDAEGGSTDGELYEDFVRSAKAFIRGTQPEMPTGMDFPELTDGEIDDLWATAHEEIDCGL